MNDAGDTELDLTTSVSPAAVESWVEALRYYLDTLTKPSDFDNGQTLFAMGGPFTSKADVLRRTAELGAWLGMDFTASERAPELLSWRPARGFRFLALRRIESLTLSWSQTSADGRWLVLLGENGTGKTTILRALALALSEDTIASACLAAMPGSLIRTNYDHAVVVIGPDASRMGRPRARILARAHRVDQLDAAYIGEPNGGEVFAYGCQRGSALGGAHREVDLRPLAQVATLFDERAALLTAGRWLADERNRMNSDEPGADASRNIVGTVCSVLAGLLPGVDRVEIASGGPIVEGPSVGRVELAALSDGYLSTIGWVVDLMARWVENQRALGVEIEPGFNRTMTGLVLIDEIDEHLHPRWQIELIPMIRRQFPRLDFVVTTHNPMTLRGARPGEVYVLDDEDGRVTARQVDVMPGVRADQVLTGPWFQLSSALVDQETLRLYREHAEMLRKDVSPDDEGRLALEDELRGRLDFFAETAEERVALKIAAQHMRGYSKLDYEERLAVRRKIEALFELKMKQRDS